MYHTVEAERFRPKLIIVLSSLSIMNTGPRLPLLCLAFALSSDKALQCRHCHDRERRVDECRVNGIVKPFHLFDRAVYSYTHYPRESVAVKH